MIKKSLNLAKEIISRGVLKLPKNSPDHLILYVTARCGSRCKHCFYANELNQIDPITKQPYQLSIEELGKISSGLGKLVQVSFTGGDPFLRVDLPEIAQIFWERNKVDAIHIPTNGLPVDLIVSSTERILKITDCDLTIAMSIDALNSEYDLFRGVKGNFVSMLKTYDYLSELKSKYPKLHLVVNTVITNLTYDRIEKLIEFVKKRMPAVELHDFDFVRGTPKDSSIALPNLLKMRRLRKILFKTYKYYYGRVEGNDFTRRFRIGNKKLQYDVNLETVSNEKQTLPCVAGQTFLVISEKGECHFCEFTGSIGNIRQNTIGEIWKGERAERMRKMIKDGALSVCDKCTHGCFIPLNILYNLDTHRRLLRAILAM